MDKPELVKQLKEIHGHIESSIMVLQGMYMPKEMQTEDTINRVQKDAERFVQFYREQFLKP